MVHFAKILEEEANAEWLPHYMDYNKLKKIIHKYKDVRHSTRQVLMITVSTYGIIIHVPTQLRPTNGDTFTIGKELRPLKEQLEVLQSKVDQNHEIEDDRMQKIISEFNKIEIDPDSVEREQAREQRFKKMRQLFGSEELLDVEELSNNRMKVVAQIIARSSVCTRHFFKVLNKELTKVNRFFMKNEGRFVQRHILLMKQLSLMKEQHKSFPKKKINKLKPAFKEHYKTLELLHRYRKFNHEGFKRIIKKYQKYTKNDVKKYFYEILSNQYFQASKVLETMKSHSEIISIEILYPYKGHRNAMNKLKLPSSSMTKKQLNSSFNTGFWLGSSAILSIFWIAFYIYFFRLTVEPDLEPIFFLFRLVLFPILLLFLIGLDIRIWNNYHINYVFIFELNPRDHISEMEILRIPLIGYSLWCASFFAFMLIHISNFLNPFYSWIPVICLYIIIFFWVINPFPFFYRSSRYWLINTIFRIFMAPFFRVQFRDFWIADQLTSTGNILFELQFLICNPQSQGNQICEGYISIGIPIFNMWPYYARFMQCIRRFKDSHQVIHIWNAGKYFSNILTLFIFTIEALLIFLSQNNIIHQQNKFSPWSSIRIAWLLCNLFSTVYKLIWDLYVDWGLLHGFKKNESGDHPKYFLLRHDILFKPWLYYLAIIINIILRFLWLPLLILKLNFENIIGNFWITFATAALEMIRRGIWNVFRLENEHLTNVGQFRVTRDIPLPMDSYGPSPHEKKKKSSFELFISKLLFCNRIRKPFMDEIFDLDDEELKEKAVNNQDNDDDKSNNKHESRRNSIGSHNSEKSISSLKSQTLGNNSDDHRIDITTTMPNIEARKLHNLDDQVDNIEYLNEEEVQLSDDSDFEKGSTNSDRPDTFVSPIRKRINTKTPTENFEQEQEEFGYKKQQAESDFTGNNREGNDKQRPSSSHSGSSHRTSMALRGNFGEKPYLDSDSPSQTKRSILDQITIRPELINIAKDGIEGYDTYEEPTRSLAAIPSFEDFGFQFPDHESIASIHLTDGGLTSQLGDFDEVEEEVGFSDDEGIHQFYDEPITRNRKGSDASSRYSWSESKKK